MTRRHENLARHLVDLEWLRIDVVLKRTLGQAQPVRIVEAFFRGAALLEFRRQAGTAGRLGIPPPRCRPRRAEPGLAGAARLGIVKSIRDPGKSGLPSAGSRACALTFGLPSGPFGIPG